MAVKTIKRQEVEIGKRTVDKIVKRRTFEPWDKPVCGCRFYRFRKRGESLEGVLGFPVQNFRQGTSYPLTLDSGETVEVVGNKLLHLLIRKGELCGRRVRIEYQGAEVTTPGRWRKIYRIFEIKL